MEPFHKYVLFDLHRAIKFLLIYLKIGRFYIHIQIWCVSLKNGIVGGSGPTSLHDNRRLELGGSCPKQTALTSLIH